MSTSDPSTVSVSNALSESNTSQSSTPQPFHSPTPQALDSQQCHSESRTAERAVAEKSITAERSENMDLTAEESESESQESKSESEGFESESEGPNTHPDSPPPSFF